MKIRDLIVALEAMDPEMLVLTGDGGYVEKFTAPSLRRTLFVREENGVFFDVTDKERDRDIPALIL